MSEHCKTMWGGVNCDFQPRYDLSEPILPQGSASFRVAEFDANDWRRKTYVCDVCRFCGKQVVRPREQSEQPK